MWHVNCKSKPATLVAMYVTDKHTEHINQVSYHKKRKGNKYIGN